jgi:hypothetical protein
LDDFRKGKVSLKESNEAAIQNIVTAEISEKERNVIFDVKYENKKNDLYALILLPAGYGVQAETIKKFSDYSLAANDSVNADILIYKGDAKIDGKVNGNISVFASNIYLGKDAKVSGTKFHKWITQPIIHFSVMAKILLLP